MNEQQLADLFSEQVDRMLNGESVQLPDDAGDLQSLLDTVQPTQTQFQASSTAQAAFQSQLASWFGLANGGIPMILGLSKAWFISIVVAVTVFVGGGLIAVIATTSVVVTSASSQLLGTDEPTAEPTTEATDEATAEPTDEATAEPTAEPTGEATAEPTAEPTDDTSSNGGLTLIFRNDVRVVSYCGGAYITQKTLVNNGSAPVDDAALAWEVVEGAEWVDDVAINSPNLMQAFNQTSIANTSLNAESLPVQSSIANFNSLSVDQDIDLDVKVKVKDTWWNESDGTKIKVKLSVKNKIDLSYGNGDGDLDRGHGNDPDGYDEDNPGRGHKKHNDDSYANQTITIVKQHGQTYTLSGIAHSYDSQSYLVDGNIVSFDDCTAVPVTFVVGTQVQIIALLQADGTFVALNVITLNSGGGSGVNVIISGDQGQGDDSNDDSDGEGGGGGGCSSCGKGGSKGGHKGGS